MSMESIEKIASEVFIHDAGREPFYLEVLLLREFFLHLRKVSKNSVLLDEELIVLLVLFFATKENFYFKKAIESLRELLPCLESREIVLRNTKHMTRFELIRAVEEFLTPILEEQADEPFC